MYPATRLPPFFVFHTDTGNMEKEEKTYQEKGIGHDRIDEELWFASSAADDTHSFDMEAGFSRFQKRIGTPVKQTFLQRHRIHLFAVASILLLMLVSIASYWKAEQNFETRFADITVEAPLKSKTKINLPDGTSVWLNGGSKIIYSQGFGVIERNLRFEGEAFFEVKKNEHIPFNVTTADLTVTVLGTKFNFRNYAEDEEAVVDLMEGKVALENHLKKMPSKFLVPSEKMVLNKKTGNIKIIPAETTTANGWTNDMLVFDDDLFPDIARELERKYGMKIQIKNDRLKEERFYGKFNIQKQGIRDVLNILSATQKLNYQIESEQLIIVD